MRIAISAIGPSLDAEVDPRFGRCRYFIIADPETMKFEVMDNSSAMAAGGAGISAAQIVANKNVQAVLTGNCGPNAYQVLSSAGIQVITGVSGSVEDIIRGYQSGKFQASAQANVPDHFGMGVTPGMKSGYGTGRGIGRGMGRGIGTGFGMNPLVNPAPQQESPKLELDALKAQSEALAQQLSNIQRRIEELGKKGRQK